MRGYRVRVAADVTHDLDLIEEHLVQSYQEFGENLDDAVERAAARIDEALAYMRTFATHPHQGTEHPRIRPGIRTVTNKSFVFYFELDEPSSEVRILATFFAGADHRQQIMDRVGEATHLCLGASRASRIARPGQYNWIRGWMRPPRQSKANS